MNHANMSAFPFTPTDRSGQIGECEPGLTKRELFAALAMQGLAPAYAQGGDAMASHVAKLAVENADALLAALAKR